MKRVLDHVWPVVGLLAVGLSFWLLAGELRAISPGDVLDAIARIGAGQLALAAAATLGAYAMLAWYDRIALLHLGVKHVSWPFVAATSFTTYALSHNIGASVLSGAMVRYRAYSSQGLKGSQVAVLVALCSFTFALGVIALGGIVLTLAPWTFERLAGPFEIGLAAQALGALLLGFVALYLAGSLLRLPPLRVGAFRLEYPRPAVSARQLAASVLDNLFTAAIVFFLMPSEANPGYVVVLAVFLAAFSAALISHAPGGLGVFELVFVAAMPDVPDAELLAALVLFRLFYLVGPFAAAILIVAAFERRALAALLRRRLGRKRPPEEG